MYYLHLDDMLELAKQQQAEVRRQAAQEALLARTGDHQPRWSLGGVARLWSSLRQRPHVPTERAPWPTLADYPYRSN